ncbi:hypothetical protein PA905_21080 [Planktothrix agardhii CCAP 1459/11A]|jgi:hypothetical protein|uniref:DUF4276 family protein n=1 Tax=Planktothrix agardhii CCAP 1459/11A TaxID=282420 RepID=A0A4P5ZDN2_PLAAG|nr:hypothetical protein [Planktothrix agardhii]GDZ94156.1 hypothetical protein PA905_21080 [Planktothrix agardhii CCAP 1459/11A]CAH2572549.1 hypothetical protein PRNO82_01954 [Planktothrix rubescens]
MKVLVIPEDFRKDQYMLKPIIKAMMSHLGKTKAQVQVCQDPLLGGVNEALKLENILAIIEQYRGKADLFILCVDRDGKEGRKQALNKLEQEAAKILTSRQSLLLVENAWQEIEVWVLAGYDLPSEWKWQEVRREEHPKERYFIPLAKQQNLLETPGEGRKIMAEKAAGNYKRLQQLCPEDLLNLEQRIKDWLDILK